MAERGNSLDAGLTASRTAGSNASRGSTTGFNAGLGPVMSARRNLVILVGVAAALGLTGVLGVARLNAGRLYDLCFVVMIGLRGVNDSLRLADRTLIGDASRVLTGRANSSDRGLITIANGSEIILYLMSAALALAREDAISALKAVGLDDLVGCFLRLMTKRLDNEIGKVEELRAAYVLIILSAVDTGPVLLSTLFGTGGSLTANVCGVVTKLCDNGISLGDLILMSTVGIILSAVGAVPVSNITVLLAAYGSACKPGDSGVLRRLSDKRVSDRELAMRIREIGIAISAVPMLEISVRKTRSRKSLSVLGIVTCLKYSVLIGEILSKSLVSEVSIAALAVPALNVTVLCTGVILCRNVCTLVGMVKRGGYDIEAYRTDLISSIGSSSARDMSRLGVGLLSSAYLALIPVPLGVRKPLISVAVSYNSKCNVSRGGSLGKCLIEIIGLARSAVPILYVTFRDTGGRLSVYLDSVMYVNVKSANGTLVAGLVRNVVDKSVTCAAHGTSMIVSVGGLCPALAEYVALRNRLCVSLSAIGVITDRGLSALDLARCISIVNVICEAVTGRVYKLRFDLAAHLTGVSDCSLVLATGINGYALLPDVLAIAATG